MKEFVNPMLTPYNTNILASVTHSYLLFSIIKHKLIMVKMMCDDDDDNELTLTKAIIL